MTLDTSISRAEFQGNGVATQFPFDFKVWDKSQIRVTISLDGVEEEQDVTTLSQIDITDTGGTVTYAPGGQALPSGRRIVISRAMPFVQRDMYITGTRFDPHEIEDALDIACAERQELREMVSRCVKVGIASATSPEEYGGLLTDLYNEIMEAFHQAGNIAGAVPVVSTGSKTPRLLKDRFSDVINVRDFGAKGDGATDDTQAIQKAVNDIRGGRVVFPNGVYVITDTIHITAERTTTESGSFVVRKDIDFDGSTIIWQGPDNDRPMFEVKSTRAILRNGTLEGAPDVQHRATVCIKLLLAFQPTIMNMVIVGFTEAGIRIGDIDNRGSYGAFISQCQITSNYSIADWENNGPDGIDVWGADCKFYQIISLRCKRHLHLHTSGHQIANCHFCSTTRDSAANDAMPETAGIWYSLENPSAWYQNTIVGCYFDNVKYVVYNDASHRTVTQITGCFYFNAGTVFDVSNAPAEAYLLGGPSGTGSPIHVTNFAIQPSPYVRFLSGVDASINYSMLSSEDYAQDLNLNMTIACPWLAKFKVHNSQSIRLTTGSESDKFTVNEMRCIGGILVHNVSRAVFRIKMVNRAYGEIDTTFKNVGGDESTWLCEIHSMFGVQDSIALSIHKPINVQIRGTAMKFVPICIKNISGSPFSGEFSCFMTSPISSIGMYLIHIGSTRFELDALKNDSGIIIDKKPLISAYIQASPYGCLPLLPDENTNSITKSLNTIKMSGKYPIFCDVSTEGAPFTGYGVLEVITVSSREGVSPHPITYQKATKLDEHLTQYYRRISGEEGSVISEWKSA